MRIQLHDQVFGTDPDSDGIYWLVTELDGWDSPAVRVSTLDPTYRPGSVLAYATYGSRAMTLRGVIKAPTETLFWKAYNRLLEITNNPMQAREFMVDEMDVRKTLYVVRSGNIRQKFVGVGASTFEVPLTAHDPIKYGEPVTTTIGSGATKSVVNPGNAISRHIVVGAQGDGTLALSTGGASLTTGGTSVGAGTVADFRARTLYLNGVNRYSQLHPMSSWWGLQPGANALANAGSTGVSITYRPAWV